ncbi:hypothetical protein C8J57DRAFT_1566832 [Mycena rebaudengoi]|nr:hypothetical protein C8J57DRAFT_1566832 [Mycena rebaudengoi]
MAPAGWASEAEKTFLFLQLPDYIQRAAAGKVGLFWGSVHEGFFQKFPERAKLGLPSATETGDAAQLTSEQRTMLENAIKARKKQIETWFRYQKRKITKGSTATASTNSHPSLVSTLFSVPTRHRCHQATEIFQRRHTVLIREALKNAGYDELNADNMPDDDDDWTDESKDTPAGHAKRLKSLRMRLRTRVVRQMFEAASAEEKASIEEELEGEKEMVLKEEAEKEKYKKTPEALQISIDELTPALGKVLNIAEKESGWVAMTIIGGPNPRMGGELSVKVVCTGETPTGNDFETFFPNFDGVVTEEFFNFLRLIFTAEARAACALPKGTGEREDVANDTPDRNEDGDPGEPDGDQGDESTPKPQNAGKKTKTLKKKKTSGAPAPAPSPAVASGGDTDMGEDVSHSGSTTTSDGDTEMFVDHSHSTPVDSEDPFVAEEPFPGASSDDFSALESGSMLGNWSWADFVAGGPQSSTDASTGGKWDGSSMDSMPGSAASSPTGRSASRAAPAPGCTSMFSSFPPGASPASSPAASSLISRMSSSPISDAAPSFFEMAAHHSAPTAPLQGADISLHGRPALFQAFRTNATPTAVFPSSSWPASVPKTTTSCPSTAHSVGASSFPFQSQRLTAPLPASGTLSLFTAQASHLAPTLLTPLPSGTVAPSTPARQPTRAAQYLTSFLSPEQRSGASAAASQGATGSTLDDPLPAASLQAPPPSTSTATSAAGSAGLSLPQTRPAAKQPAAKPSAKATQLPPKARGRKKVLVDATNAVVAPGAVSADDADSAATAAHQLQAEAMKAQNDPALAPLVAVSLPPEEKQGRARRAPRLPDGSAPVRLVKRTREEMKAARGEEVGTGAASMGADGSHKRRKTSA